MALKSISELLLVKRQWSVLLMQGLGCFSSFGNVSETITDQLYVAQYPKLAYISNETVKHR